MTTASFFDDDDFRKSEVMQALQKMVRESMAPAMQVVQQANAANVAKIMETLRPTFAAISADAAKSISKIVLPAIEMPKIAFSFKNLQQIKLGDEVAREVSSSVDYTSVAKSVATEVEETAPENIAEIKPEAFTEEQLDTLTAHLFARRPELAERFYSDADITMLSPGQKKMLAWQWALSILFVLALLFAWAKVDENVDYVMDIATNTTLAVSGYRGANKALQANDDEDGDSEDKKEGA